MRSGAETAPLRSIRYGFSNAAGADPEFRTKPKFAPWVDAVIRLQGPIARQNQILLATDWMTYTSEELALDS